MQAAIIKGKRKIFQIISLHKNKFLEENKIKYEIKNVKYFNKIFGQSHISHQGIAALVSTIPNTKLEDITEEKTIIMLDGITDPMNTGSIIRNCAAFGIDSIIVRDREFNENSSSMIKASSGAIEEVKICKISNLNNAIKYLKTKEFWITCLDSHANKNIKEFKWPKKNLIIFGSEGLGVSHLVKKNCDTTLKININKNVESLNVSNAVAITLYCIQSEHIK